MVEQNIIDKLNIFFDGLKKIRKAFFKLTNIDRKNLILNFVYLNKVHK